MGQSAAKNKGKISRVLAAKTSLSARVDALGDKDNVSIGLESRAKVEQRLSQVCVKPLEMYMFLVFFLAVGGGYSSFRGVMCIYAYFVVHWFSLDFSCVCVGRVSISPMCALACCVALASRPYACKHPHAGTFCALPGRGQDCLGVLSGSPRRCVRRKLWE